MTKLLVCFAATVAVLAAGAVANSGRVAASKQQSVRVVSLFDGKTFDGWEGDTTKTWKIRDGALVGGSLTEEVPRNDFLTTKAEYANFVLKLKFKLTGTGFVNGGVQFRSQRAKDPPHEMVGYQADIGAKYWGVLYDETRRNRILAGPENDGGAKLVKMNDWNDYEIRAEGRRIQLFLNGQQTVDYTEPDTTLPQTGLIGLQIHGGGKAEISFRDLVIQLLP